MGEDVSDVEASAASDDDSFDAVLLFCFWIWEAGKVHVALRILCEGAPEFLNLV